MPIEPRFTPVADRTTQCKCTGMVRRSDVGSMGHTGLSLTIDKAGGLARLLLENLLQSKMAIPDVRDFERRGEGSGLLWKGTVA